MCPWKNFLIVPALCLVLATQPAYAWKVFKENPFKHPPKILTHPKKKIESVIGDLKKNVDEISDEWNKFRESKVDPIGDAIELTVRSLRDGAKLGFPERFGDRRMAEVKDPTIKFALSGAMLNEIVAEYVKEDIPLDERVKTGVATNNYIHIAESRLEFDDARNIMRLRIGKGRLGLEALKADVGLQIEDAEIELAPTIKNVDGRMILEIHARMVYLDLNNNMNWLDRSIAQAVEKVALAKRPVTTIDLTESFKFSLPVINSKRVVNNGIKEFSLGVRAGWIEVLAKTKI